MKLCLTIVACFSFTKKCKEISFLPFVLLLKNLQKFIKNHEVFDEMVRKIR
ncbi:hypothetical protein MtrunA17_Chr8g0351131 [Medicago truncatula]|uniref:Uncharacterized protein n=1 Tax=Medicago truncatula TaxID=3880 RepID=A0A396GN64_MEDTR|nr:hypothetical protein MtrunA17_Chr8g0351131 [Medicago truncatula]